jgi:hypothetical protein
MAGSRMPVAFFTEWETLLPAEEPMGPEGGRSRVPHRAVMKVLLHVVVRVCRWENGLLEGGCLGRTAHGRLQPIRRSFSYIAGSAARRRATACVNMAIACRGEDHECSLRRIPGCRAYE